MSNEPLDPSHVGEAVTEKSAPSEMSRDLEVLARRIRESGRLLGLVEQSVSPIEGGVVGQPQCEPHDQQIRHDDRPR